MLEKKQCIQKRINVVCMFFLGIYFSFHGINAMIFRCGWLEHIVLYFVIASGIIALIRLCFRRDFKS